MAVLRNAMICPLCGGKIEFIYNKLTKQQMESGWCGDQGGEYDWVGHIQICKLQARNNKIDKILVTHTNPSSTDRP